MAVDGVAAHGRTLIGLFALCLLGMLCIVLHEDRIALQRTLARAEAAERKEAAAMAAIATDPPTPTPSVERAQRRKKGFLYMPRRQQAAVGRVKGCHITDATNLTKLRRQILATAAEVALLELELGLKGTKYSAAPQRKMKTSYKDPAPRSTQLYQKPYVLPDKTAGPGLKMDPFPIIERGCRGNLAVLLSEDEGILKNGTASCKALDIIYQRSGEGRCTVVMDQPCTWHNYVYKYDGEYWGSGSTWSVAMNTNTGRPKQVPDTRNVMYAGNMMRDLLNRDELIVPFLKHKNNLMKELKKVIGHRGRAVRREGLTEQEGRNETILVMAANDGHSTMVINFFCDLHKRGLPTPRHVVFTATEKLRDELQKLGITAFWNEHLGSFNPKAEAVYGTIGFGRLTYMKQFSTYLALLLGWDVLFQDADVTWPKDPFPALLAGRDKYHAQFMDDGARTFRFAPFFANSGFYYLTNRHPGGGHIVEFWDQVTMSMAESQTGNQEVLNAILEYQVKNRAFKVRILPPEQFASGKYLGPPKNEGDVEKINSFLVAHFCWTHNMEVKRERMTEYNSRHLGDTCFNDIWKCKIGELPTPKKFITNSSGMCSRL
eukprot:m.128023 g.128023  ORF g.128023 m.128023 type:complete len:602 (-) comp13618_c0_seq1:52-1857(-)